MARRSSSPVSFLTTLLLALLIFLLVRQNQRPGRHRGPTSVQKQLQESLRPYPEERSRESGRRSEKREEQMASCQSFAVTCNSRYFQSWQQPEDGGCTTTIRNGFPVPDARCTPGGIDPSVTADMLRDPSWRTGCVRNCQTSEQEKHVTYRWYGTAVPRRNSGGHQVCELDHLVPLELGGADGLGNIWPECGPSAVPLPRRYFKLKDRVENYLADEVKAGRMPLEEAQRGIANDWTQFLPAANRYCAAGGRC